MEICGVAREGYGLLLVLNSGFINSDNSALRILGLNLPLQSAFLLVQFTTALPAPDLVLLRSLPTVCIKNGIEVHPPRDLKAASFVLSPP